MLHEPDRRDSWFDWGAVFKSGDVVGLEDGRVGVVQAVWDCNENESPPQFEMYVRFKRRPGVVDAAIVSCRDFVPAPDDARRAEASALLD